LIWINSRCPCLAQAGEADALRDRADELQAGQELMMDMHAHALAAAQDQLERAWEAADGLRQPRRSGGRGGCWRASGAAWLGR
jgi:hypothetical protein